MTSPYVTDPKLLAELDSDEEYVSDPALLASLDSEQPAGAGGSLPPFAEGMAGASESFLHMVAQSLMAIPRGVSSLAASATGNDRDAVREAFDSATPDPRGPVARSFDERAGQGAAEALAPTVGAISKGYGAVENVIGPTASSVLRHTGNAAMDVLDSVPLFGAMSAAKTGGTNLLRRAERLMPEPRATETAARIARNAAGESIDSIRAAGANAPTSLTAGQAAHGIKQDTWQALAEMAARNDKGSFYSRTADMQEVGRQGALQGATPDLATALAARESASAPFYGYARSQNVPVKEKLADALTRMPKGIVKSAEELARVEGGPFTYTPPNTMFGAGVQNAPEQISGDALHYIKLALDEAGKPRAMASPDDAMISRAAMSLKPEYLGAVEEAIPPYATGRQTFAKLSRPVNQSEIMSEMQQVLKAPGGGERVEPFLKAIENTNSPLVRKATGDARYTAADLPKVLNENQMSVVNDIVRQLNRDSEIASQAKSGAGGLARILEENKSGFRIPHFFNPKITAANNMLMRAETSINRKVIDKLVEGMKSGKSANELMKGLGPVEKAELSALTRNTPAFMAASGASNVAQALADRDRKENK